MGATLSFVKNWTDATIQAWPPKPKFSTDQIPDLTGKVVIVTGASTGVGKETAKVLLEHNAKVYVATRNKAKTEAALAELKEQTGKDAIWLELDLADLKSVRHAAKEFMMKEQELHILFNNAGVMFCPVDLVTVDGYDMQFGTNVIGHFLFGELLMPLLINAASNAPDGHARIVTTSSSMAYLETLHYETFKATPESLKARKKLNSHFLYCQSKFGNAVVAKEIARRYADKGILSYSCNPGNLRTELHRHLTGLEPWLIRKFSYPQWYGALTQLWAGTMPDVVDHNGEFLIPWARFGRCREELYDPKIGEELWNWLEAEVKQPTEAA